MPGVSCIYATLLVFLRFLVAKKKGEGAARSASQSVLSLSSRR
jgi:hypothetical protein